MIIRDIFGKGALRSQWTRVNSGFAQKAQQWRLIVARHYSSESRQWSTPLAQTIAQAIKTTGPISIAAYMRQCLTSPEGGYYTSESRKRDQIGQKGDFITSPEISQIFGELMGIWFVSQWIAQGRPGSGVELIEVGPGKGTLMDDVLRTIKSFQPMASSVEAIYLVEASKSLRLQQHQLLCGPESKLDEISIGWKSRSKYADIPVTWVEEFKSVPDATTKTPFIIAHEFFDALPIHAFQSIPPSAEESQTLQGLHGPIKLSKPTESSRTSQWRELLVTNMEASAITSTASRPALNKAQSQGAEFQLTLAKASTPSSMLLPEASERYKALKAKPHSIIEVSPESHALAADMARRIGGTNILEQQSGPKTRPTSKPTPSGAALIIDYGPTNIIPTNTLRGIRSHKQASPFSFPGEVDLSADVDFTALAEVAIDASEGVEVHGPMEQGEWLQRMGIHERAKALSDNAAEQPDATETSRKIQASVQRLTERGGGAMGKVYKVMAIVPESGGQRPVGFGGGVQG